MSTVFTGDYKVAYSSGLNAAIRTNLKPAPAPSSPIVETAGGAAGKLALWGEDNLRPQNIKKAVANNSIIPQALQKKAAFLVDGGVQFGRIEETATGKEIFRSIRDAEVDAFLRQPAVKGYFREAAVDYSWYANIFPEMLLSLDRKKFTSICHQESAYCRWELQNKEGVSEYCYINANWDKGATTESKNTIKVKAIDPYNNPIAQIQTGKEFKYIYPIHNSSVGNTYYQEDPWHSILDSGWLDIASAIPQFKKAVLDNQITIKYIIEIATWWWKWKYEDWNEVDNATRQKRVSAELDRFEAFMSGNNRAGNSLIVTFDSNPQTREEYAGWKVTAVDNKLKDGAYLEDSQEASSHILFAIGMDPTLIGNSPGKSMGGGSGSDKRVAYNIQKIVMQPDQEAMLEPLLFIAEYNGWLKKYPDGIFRFKNSLITTLDQGTETKAA